MQDPTVRRLTKKIFPYLWLRHKLMSSVPSTGIFQFSDLSKWIGSAVIIYLHAYRPALCSYLEKHIPPMPQSKIQFWSHVSFLCLQIRLLNDDVFDYFLTTCAITAEVALHCHVNGYDDVLSLASVFFCAFFESELCEGFHEAGGWEGLQQYIEDTSCKELYELVNDYVKELESPGERLPILITIQYEQLAAGRREKLVSLSSLKVGEIEREYQTKKLVSRIFHWHFMENHRMSEVKPGILKRMENVRHKKRPCISIVNGKHEDVSEPVKTLYVDNKMSDVEPPGPNNDVQSSESVATMSETRLTKTTQTLDDSKFMKVKKGSIPRSTDISEKTNSSSPNSLRKLREFYESLSTSSEKKVDDSKYFRSNNETRNELKSSAIGESVNAKDTINFESNSKYASNPSEDVRTLPQSKDCALEKASRPAESFHTDDFQYEFTKSFKKLGFRCLYVKDSPPLHEKYASFPNEVEVIEKCRYFQTKYPSTQFAILIPNNYFNEDASHAPETENCNVIFSEKKFSNKNLLGITKEDFENGTALTQIHHPEDDKRQIRLANGLLSENCTGKNNQSRFVVTKVNENGLCPTGQTSKISRFSVTKVNENHILSDGPSLEIKCASEIKAASRFKVTRVDENHSNATKISRFTVSKVHESQLNGYNRIPGKNCQNGTAKISRFTVTKVNENRLSDGTRILGKNWKDGATEISRFTVTKVNENEAKDSASILRRNWKNGTINKSRFSVFKVDENEPMSRAGMSLRKSCLTNATKISRFTDTDNGQTGFAKQNYSTFGEFFDEDNETVHFQDNGSVKYQKRVSFDEHPLISYYQTYSSEDSINSIASRESLARISQDPQSSKNSGQEDTFNSKTLEKNLEGNSQEDAQSSRNSANQKEALNTPILRNPSVNEKRSFLKRLSSGDKQATSDNAGSSNNPSGSSLFGRFFKRSSRNNKMAESSAENKEEMDKEKMEESRVSSEAAGVKYPNVFKV